MSALKTLKFTATPNDDAKALISNRTWLIDRLEEQKQLLADPSFVRTSQVWSGKGDQRTMTERRQRVSPWWQLDQSGSYVLLVRFGRKPIEFEKDKPGIVVPSLDKLASIIDTVIAAARSGELDPYMKPGTKPKTPTPGTKKAA